MKYFLIAFVFVFSITVPAFAHEHLSDGAVKAMLYYDPHHDPEATVPTIVHFDFLDTTPEIDFAHCNCTFSITHNGASAFAGHIGDGVITEEDSIVSFPYTFSETGNYTIAATGTYQKKTFTLLYIQNVLPLGSAPTEETASTASMSHMHTHDPLMTVQMALMALAPVLAGLFVLVQKRRERAL